MPGRRSLARFLDALEMRYGPPEPPPSREPFALVLWENVAYLVNDERRAAAFAALGKQIGWTPERILAAPARLLRGVAALGGMLPDERVGKLLRAAEVAQKRFGSDLAAVVCQPFLRARKALMAFPGIGEPGAEKILLFAGAHPVLALDSNALRVLIRLGFGEEKKSYAATYRSAQEAAKRELRDELGALLRAHLLLRRHGQELCRRNRPQCADCPVAEGCAFYRAAVGSR